MLKHFLLISTLLLTSCAYTLDIQQGNIIDQKVIDKLRPELTKDQVVFVLGNPVVDDSFADDSWVYLYTYKNKNSGIDNRKRLTLKFVDDKLVSASGDYEIPEAFLAAESTEAAETSEPTKPTESTEGTEKEG